MKSNLIHIRAGSPGSVPGGHHGLISWRWIPCVYLVVFAVVMLPAKGTRAEDADRPAVVIPAAGNDVATLVAQLGAESFEVREKAMKDLWRIGPEVLPALRKAQEGGDPEVADRAGELVLYISAGVLFDSPEDIKEMVMKFSRANGEAKLVIMRKLMELKHWRQVLHLARFEKNPAIRAKMSEVVRKVAHDAARTAIANGDLDLAGEIFELTGDDMPSLQMRAWFECHRGRLEHELEKAAGMAGKKGAVWRMSLYRAVGNIPAAIREAEKAGEQKIADALRVLDGDALPWLRRNSRVADDGGVFGMGCRIQQLKLQGDEKQAASVALKLVNAARDPESAHRVVGCLAANGFRNEAIKLLRRYDEESTFDYFDTIESPQLSLEVFGIPEDAKPPYDTWVKQLTANAVEKEDDRLYDRLIMLASFLVAHGEGQHAIAVLTPLMSELESDDSDDWFGLIGSMARYGLGAEAIHFIKQRGNKHGETDLGVEKLLSRVLSKSRSHVWKRVKERNDDDIGNALDELALLVGLVDDPENKTDKLHQALVDEVAEAEPDVRHARMTALFTFCLKRNDFATASSMADEMAQVNNRWLASKGYLDNALLRWKSVEASFAKLQNPPRDCIDLIKWYVSLRKLGRDQKAKEVYGRAMLLSMGDAALLSNSGWWLYEVGYEDEAAELWLLAAAIADPGGSGYDSAINFLAHYAQPLYRSGQWKRAVAISEASIQLVMRGKTNMTLQSVLRSRYHADFCRGMMMLKNGNKSAAISKLDAARRLIPGDGLLADDFFPILLGENLGPIYDRWFDESYRHIEAACQRYPDAHNSHNTAAWLAARAVRKLDAAHKHAEKALKMRPSQGAYLDTMAEVWFARGNREKALEWSRKAIAGSISNARGNPRRERYVISNYKQLNKQFEHFKNDPMPGAAR